MRVSPTKIRPVKSIKKKHSNLSRMSKAAKQGLIGEETASLLSTPPDSARKTRINKRKRMIRSLTTIRTGAIKISKGGKPDGITFKTTTIKPNKNTVVKLQKSTTARSKKRRGEGRSTSRLSSQSAKSTKSV